MLIKKRPEKYWLIIRQLQKITRKIESRVKAAIGTNEGENKGIKKRPAV
jgi:hypothetical protein